VVIHQCRSQSEAVRLPYATVDRVAIRTPVSSSGNWRTFLSATVVHPYLVTGSYATTVRQLYATGASATRPPRTPVYAAQGTVETPQIGGWNTI